MLRLAKNYSVRSKIARAFLRISLYFKKIEEQNMLSMFNEELKQVDSEINRVQTRDIPQLLRNIPLDVFGKLLLDVPSEYKQIKAFFPSMASEEVQKNWTGTHGEALLNQSLAFTKTMISGYAAISGKRIEDAKILDYGCGWGRLIRLLYKYIPIENIYGVDPWDESINICRQNNLKANLAISDYVPLSLPFGQQFDLIFSFSVFTHLSEKTAHTVLKTLRKYISSSGLLVITIRPKEYWSFHRNGEFATQMLKTHAERGFAFTPHNRPPIEGDITYGDTSISIDYITRNFHEWHVEAVEWNEIDPYQVILFLAPK